MYVYDWVTILYSRNWHNIVNQLYLNKKVIGSFFLGGGVSISIGIGRAAPFDQAVRVIAGHPQSL